MIRASQLVLGKYEEDHFSLDSICEKIKKTDDRFKLDRLMIWNSLDKRWFDRIADLCRSLRIEPYLWFPVLSDQLEHQVSKEEAVFSICGDRGYGNMGTWELLLHAETLDENFLFLCPNNSKSIDPVFHHFQELVDTHDIEGVFLDRIRYPSPVNGIGMLSSCFCENCKRKTDNFSEDLKEKVTNLTDKLLEMIQSRDVLYSYHELIDSFVYEGFFRDKQLEIKDLVSQFAEYAQSKGRMVGLDLFTPSLAPLVSQDYRILSECCDWIKPMIYCKAWGPAGMPLELSCLLEGLKEFINSNNRGREVDTQELWSLVNNVLDIRLPNHYEGFKKDGLPASLVVSEYEKAKSAVSQTETEIIPGLEFVDHPLFPTRISSEECKVYIDELRKLECGFISCWNILYIPDNYFSLMSRVWD